MKRILFLATALCVATTTFAQGEMDAIRMSQTDLKGSARGIAMGGAFGALGGDITGIGINPAGLGVYRSSELSASLGFSSVKANTNWNSIKNNENKNIFNFDNISYAGYFPTGIESMPALNFSFSFNRAKNFNRRLTAAGSGIGSSLTDYIVQRTNGIDPGKLVYDKNYDPFFDGVDIPWLSIIGYTPGLIEGGPTYSSCLKPGETVAPVLNATEKGHIDNYDFSFGSNFSDKFYLGLGVSVTDLYYELTSGYTEYFGNNNTEYIGLDNRFKTSGTGYQVKIGAIWKPADWLRLGVAYHSPTWYALRDRYVGTGLSSWDGKNETFLSTPDDAYTEYQFSSPYSVVLSAAGVIGKSAIVSVDYELKDYRSMSLADYDGYPNKEQNNYIDEDFRMASILRAGFEYRFTPQLSGRLGYAWMQQPYASKMANGKQEAGIIGTVTHYVLDGDVNYLTAGIGYRFTPQFSMDFALTYRMQNSKLYAFPVIPDSVDSTPADLKQNTAKALVTLAYRF